MKRGEGGQKEKKRKKIKRERKREKNEKRIRHDIRSQSITESREGEGRGSAEGLVSTEEVREEGEPWTGSCVLARACAGSAYVISDPSG